MGNRSLIIHPSFEGRAGGCLFTFLLLKNLPFKPGGVEELSNWCSGIIAAAGDRITPVSIVRQVPEKYREMSTYKEFANPAHWVVAEPGWEEHEKNHPCGSCCFHRLVCF